MNRGAAKQIIFHDDGDRSAFLEIWEKAVSRFGIVVLSFCLLDNHFHFLVQSPKRQLSSTMQYVLQTYTQSFNKKHGRDGALFRGRFHSVLVETDTYFERVGRYIERNPIEAGITTSGFLHNYRWSSFQYYARTKRTPSWLNTTLLTSRYGNPDQYLHFVRSNMADQGLDDFYSRSLRPTVVLGRRAFIDKVKSEHEIESEMTAGIPEVTPADIDAVVCEISQCSKEQLSGHVGAKHARQAATALVRLLTNTSRQAVAERYGHVSVNAVWWAAQPENVKRSPEAHRVFRIALAKMGRDRKGHPIIEPHDLGVDG